MTNDLPIHLGSEWREARINLNQQHLDGLQALIHYCKGVEDSGQGIPPGSFELIMHYRGIRNDLGK